MGKDRPAAPNGSLLERAIAFAVAAHYGQTHDSGSPYILHPLRVMLRLKEQGNGEDAILAVGVLHDTLEDTAVNFAQLKKHFGLEIATEVFRLSRHPEDSYETFIERVSKSRIATIVKMADIEDNLKLSETDPLPEPRQTKLRNRYIAAQKVLAQAI